MACPGHSLGASGSIGEAAHLSVLGEKITACSGFGVEGSQAWASGVVAEENEHTQVYEPEPKNQHETA